MQGARQRNVAYYHDKWTCNCDVCISTGEKQVNLELLDLLGRCLDCLMQEQVAYVRNMSLKIES